jgi:hypothetical protein
MYFKKIGFFVVFIAVICCASNAQITTSFSFGSILTSDGGASFSGPIVVDGKNECFTVRNGVPLFENNNSGAGKFMMNCETSGNSDFVFETFPNPAVSYANVYVNGKINTNDTYQMFLYNIQGNLLQSSTGTLGQFRSGLKVDLFPYSDGIYLIKVKTKYNEKSFKLVKIKN